MSCRLAGAILLAGLSVATAAPNPNVPSSELPGRERQRFLESPVDRFTQPKQKTRPLWWWDCPDWKQKPKRGKRKDC